MRFFPGRAEIGTHSFFLLCRNVEEEQDEGTASAKGNFSGLHDEIFDRILNYFSGFILIIYVQYNECCYL
jgi:hypothetical protein